MYKTMGLTRKILLLSLGLGLGLIECTLRLIEPSATNRFNIWPPGLIQEFATIPGVMQGVSAKTTFSINEQGIRGDAFEEGQDVRMLALGGSTTECLYLDDSKAWPSVMQDRLNHGGGKRYWVGNVGKSGRTSDQHVLDIEKLPPQYPHIDTVLVLVGVNDLHKKLMRGNQPYSPDDIRVPYRREAVLRRSFLLRDAGSSSSIVRAISRWRDSSAAATQTGVLIQGTDGSVFARLRTARASREARLDLPDLDIALRQYEVNLHAIADEAARQGLRLIFLSQPTIWRRDLTKVEQASLWMGGLGDFFSVTSRAYYSVDALAEGMRIFNEQLREVCKQRAVELIDLAKQLPKDATVFYDDVHFTEHGASRVASIVARYLRKHPSAPQGCNPEDRVRSAQPLETVTDLAKIKNWGPRDTMLGAKFNLRATGECAMWFRCEGMIRSTQYIQFGETILPTTRSKGLITASISTEIVTLRLANAREFEIALVDVDQRKKQVLGQFRVK